LLLGGTHGKDEELEFFFLQKQREKAREAREHWKKQSKMDKFTAGDRLQKMMIQKNGKEMRRAAGGASLMEIKISRHH